MKRISKEELELRDVLRTLINSAGWLEVYTRGVDRMRVAQTKIMALSTPHEERAQEVAVWNAIKKLIEFPEVEIEHITHLEERDKET